MSNVITLRRTLSGETALQRLDRELTLALQSRNEAIRLREHAHRLVCQIEAGIFMAEAVRVSALQAAGADRASDDGVRQ